MISDVRNSGRNQSSSSGRIWASPGGGGNGDRNWG